MVNAGHDVLACMGFPAAHRARLHTTDPIERLNGEIKRPTEVVGLFPNQGAIPRLIGTILMEQSEVWAVRRARCMTLETMAPVSVRQEIGPPDQFLPFLTPIVMLSAVPGA
jgi:putative transposase